MTDYYVPTINKFSWQLPVEDKDLETSPAEPSKGDRYIVKATGGDWSGGAAKDITYYDGSDWVFVTPVEGWQCWVKDEDQYYYFDGSNWIAKVDASSVNAALSSTILTGGEISAGTNAGTIKVAALTAMLRTGSGASDPLVKISLSEQDNVTLAAIDTWYKVRLTYGTPNCTIATSVSSGNGANIIGIGHCLRESDGTRHYSDAGLRLTDGVRKLHQRASSLREIEISSGGLCSDPAPRYLQITAGVFYRGINRFTTSEFDSTGSYDWFEYYYWNPEAGPAAWIKDAGGPYQQIDNSNYNKVDNGSGKAALGSHKYTTNWIFLHPDDEHVLVLYGRSNTSLTAAENEEIPPSLPDILDEMAVLLCKVIVQKGSDDLIFENVKYFTFTPQVTADHNELQGLQGGQAGQYNHLTDAELAGLGGAAVAFGRPIVFTPQCNEPPAANFATLDTRNSHPVLDFAIDEIAVFSSVMPQGYADGGLTVYLHYAMTSAEANDIKLEAYIERIGDGQQDLDDDGFAAAQNTGDITVPGTSGLVDIISIAFTHGAQMDSLAAGESFRIKIKRIAVTGTDAAGDLELTRTEIKET